MNKTRKLYMKAVLAWCAVAVVVFCTQTIALHANNRMHEHNQIGLAYAEQGEYDKAIAEYTKALEYGSDLNNKTVTYYNRGVSYYLQDEYGKAIDDYTRAIALFTDDTDKAKAYYDKGERARL